MPPITRPRAAADHDKLLDARPGLAERGDSVCMRKGDAFKHGGGDPGRIGVIAETEQSGAHMRVVVRRSFARQIGEE